MPASAELKQKRESGSIGDTPTAALGALPGSHASASFSGCRSPAHLRSWLQQFARGFGFYGGRYMHIGHLPSGGQRAEHERPMRFLSTAARECEVGDGGLHGDPAVALARTAFEPFTWTTRPRTNVTDRQRAWLSSELAKGVGAGIAIPVQDYAAGPAYLSLFGVDEARAARLLDERAPEFAFTAAQFHALAKALLPVADGATVNVSLTRREIEVLRLAALGWTVLDSAAALSIAGRTVEFHLSNACEKLNAVSKIHAVAIATTRQMIAI